MARGVTWFGAAAVALGVCLAGPCGLAAADSDANQDPSTAANQRTDTHTASPSAGPRTAAARVGRPQTRSANTADPRADRRTPTAPGAARAALPARLDARNVRRTPGPDVSTLTPALASAGGTDAPDQAAVTPPLSAPQAPAPAPTVGTVAVPAAASTTTADGLSNPLGPVESFIEGVILLVRRTFFNQPPTVAPEQTTGQTTGPITGTIGAVDPEGDPITYTVISRPQFGTVEVAADGTYLYSPGSTFTGIDTFTVSAADTGFHINLLNPFRPAATLANAVVEQGRPVRVMFDFSYTGLGLLWTQEARSALQTAATLLSSYFLVDTPVTVTYSVDGQFSPFSGQLATATSDMISSRAGFFPTVVQQKIIAGIDVNGSTADGTITWNFANPWALNGTANTGEYDFQSVAMHELMHTFGFLSNVQQAGSNTDTTWTRYDGFLVTSADNAVIGGDFAWNPLYDTNLTGGSGGLYFGGANAIAAFGGPVPLYTPNPWQGGSSVSHLNDATFSGRNKQLMIARVSTGTGIKTLSAIETGIMTDLGYTMVTPPATSTVVMLGFFVVMRRRRATNPATRST